MVYRLRLNESSTPFTPSADNPCERSRVFDSKPYTGGIVNSHSTRSHLLAGCEGMQRDGADAAGFHRRTSSNAPDLGHGALDRVAENSVRRGRSQCLGTGVLQQGCTFSASWVLSYVFFHSESCFGPFQRAQQTRSAGNMQYFKYTTEPPCFQELKDVLSHRGNGSLLDEPRVHGRKIG